MKKYLTLTFLILTVALSYYFMNNSTFSKSELQLSEVEALSDCEIYKPDGTLIKKCIGKEPVCHTIVIGSGTLSCFGKQIYPKQ